MRIRYSILIIPLVVAACASSAGSPSAAAPSAAGPSVAPSEAPSVAPSEAPSVAPSEAAAPPDPFTTYREETLQPALDQVTTALPQFGDAFTAATASGASDTDRIAFATAAFKLRVALESGTALLAAEAPDLPECGVEAQTQAQGFFAKLTEDSQDLLGATANADQASAVTAFVEEATTSATELTTAIDQACA
jgi:hypothetical protein